MTAYSAFCRDKGTTNELLSDLTILNQASPQGHVFHTAPKNVSFLCACVYFFDVLGDWGCGMRPCMTMTPSVGCPLARNPKHTHINSGGRSVWTCTACTKEQVHLQTHSHRHCLPASGADVKFKGWILQSWFIWCYLWLLLVAVFQCSNTGPISFQRHT